MPPRYRTQRPPPPKIKVTHEYTPFLGGNTETFEVDVLVPYWAMHKFTGGEPSKAFEDNGGEECWEVYVRDMAETVIQKKILPARRA